MRFLTDGRAHLGAVIFASFLALQMPTGAEAQASLIGGFGGTVDYGTSCLSRNDDGSSPQIDLAPAFPSGLRFFDTTHTRAFVNTNGNITFNARLSTFTARAFPVAAQPMIAPYWADVDIRRYPVGGSCQGSAGTTCTACTPCHNPTENGVWWHLEPGRMIVTWDRVGYFSCNNNLRMSFQLILSAVPGCGGEGDFDVEFRYNRCEWTTGNASGGSGGFGGTPAQAGFDAGNESDFVMIPGSRTGEIHNILCGDSNVGEPGVWRFQIRSGVVTCPDAGVECDTGLLGVCGTGRTNCVGEGTECVQDVSPSPEVCDNLDNDCNGMVDDGDDLCPVGQQCVAGECVQPCFEFACNPGEICTESGLCVDESCIDVTCPEGERCVDGSCVDVCAGVVCPGSTTCRGGRCVDLCEGLDCDECTVCVEGRCDLSCEYAECGAGTTCTDEGLCVDTACLDVRCPAGTSCRGGECVDDCEGAVCPRGQVCQMGRCVAGGDGGPTMPPPSGSDGGGDPSPMIDGGPELGDDDGGDDERPLRRAGGPGCGCRSAGGSGGAPLALLFAALALVLRRRRR